MSLLGNLVWLLFGGFLTGLGYLVLGAVMCLTIVGIPFGLQAIKVGLASFAPFGMEIEEAPGSGGALQTVANLIWLVFAGWALAVHHLFWGLVLALTIIGLPFAQQHIKLIPISLFPFGKVLVRRG